MNFLAIKQTETDFVQQAKKTRAKQKTNRNMQNKHMCLGVYNREGERERNEKHNEKEKK